MRVTGQVLVIEPYSGTFADRESGDKVAYSGTRVSVFDGREVVKVKVKARESAALGDIKKGDEVDFLVDVLPEGSGGRIYLTVTFVERLNVPSPHLAAVSKAN